MWLLRGWVDDGKEFFFFFFIIGK